MTQIERIREIIRKFDVAELFTGKEIENETGFPKSSIRRTLGSLVKTEEINRVEPGLFVRKDISQFGVQIDESEDFRRKFIGTQKYKDNPRQFFAVTYEKNDIDRESELLIALGKLLNENYVQSAGDTGYSIDSVEPRDVLGEAIFPNIQVGKL